MNKLWIALCCLLACGWAVAQTEEGGLQEQAEHQRITAERAQIAQRFAQEEAACYQKFAVNDCLDGSRTRRRTALADLRRQEILLNDAERKRKGAQQMQRMEQSTAQDTPEALAAPREKSSVRVRTHPPTEPRQPHDPAQTAAAQAARKATLQNKVQAAQEAQAARDRKAATLPAERAHYVQKQQEAADHKAQTLQRNAERTKPKAAPLPEPAQ
jgi:colicin import membrane protein